MLLVGIVVESALTTSLKMTENDVLMIALTLTVSFENFYRRTVHFQRIFRKYRWFGILRMDWYDRRWYIDRPSKRTMRRRIYSSWMGWRRVPRFHQRRNDGRLSRRLWRRKRRRMCSQMQCPHRQRQRRLGKSNSLCDPNFLHPRSHPFTPHLYYPLTLFLTSGINFRLSVSSEQINVVHLKLQNQLYLESENGKSDIWQNVTVIDLVVTWTNVTISCEWSFENSPPNFAITTIVWKRVSLKNLNGVAKILRQQYKT